MGIQGFYAWLCQRYPLIIKNLRDISRPIIDNLYLDLNQIITSAFPKNMYPRPTNQVIGTLRYIDTIVQLIRPTTIIFIAIDGTPPFNKIYKQMKNISRNFITHPPELHEEGRELDNSVITPGSLSYQKFQTQLLKLIGEKTEKDPAWMTPQVIYSSSYMPGEAEHKIFEFIQERTKLYPNQTNEVHCAFSNDADLIPLIMLTSINNFIVIRTPPSQSPEFNISAADFDLAYINILREYLVKDFANIKTENIFSDWVFLITLLGNDYFEGFMKVTNKRRSNQKASEDISDLMTLYEKVILRQNLSLLDPETKEIDLPNFLLLLKHYFNEIDDDYEEEDLEDMDDQIVIECKKLIKNFTWILQYYMTGCPSWSYYYSCEKKITLRDMFDFLRRFRGKYLYLSFEEKDEPLTPFEYYLAHFSSSIEPLLPNVMIQKFIDYVSNCKKKSLFILPYKDVKNINREAFPELGIEEQKRNIITDKYTIIENGNFTESFGMVPSNRPLEDTWIPSLNKIEDFFEKSGHKSKLKPRFSYDYDLYPVEYLNKIIQGKVILVDYPFLKPFLVKSVQLNDPENLPNLKGIEYDNDQNLTVIGYPIISSSTDFSSISVCSQKKRYPYCLTAPLVPALMNVMKLMQKPRASILKVNHKALIVKKGKNYGKIGLIKIINFDIKKVGVYVYETNHPDLSEVFQDRNNVIKFDRFADLENILTRFKPGEEKVIKKIKLDFDDIVWEGKKIEKEQNPKIGDRVAFVMYGGKNEFGQFGSIVDYDCNYEEVSVVFDHDFMYGCSLRGKLKTARGMIGKNYDFYIL